MYSWVDNAIRAVGEQLLPPLCVLCGGRGAAPAFDLCLGCRDELVLNDSACVVCAQPLPGNTLRRLRCGTCLRRAPRFDQSFCPYRYVYPLDHMARAFKYSRQLTHGRVLGDLLAARIAERANPAPQILLPVPLAPGRFRERGFNQATQIAQRLERALRIPLATDKVVRLRETGEQAALDRKARRRNVRGAFAVVRPLKAHHVAIVDDVMTTGSTVDELARTLRKAGAKHIEVWAVARAGK